jgi:nucleotide-binding universal stress UspA family protein
VDHVILVGVDQSAGAQRALLWAAEHAHRNQLEVDAVHVLTPSAEFNRDLSLASFTAWRRDLHHLFQHQWVRPLIEASVGYRAQLVEDNTVEDGLLAVAERDDALLIVLGAHGHGEIKDRLLGSVTHRIAHRADRPVVIIPARWNSARHSRSGIIAEEPSARLDIQ